MKMRAKPLATGPRWGKITGGLYLWVAGNWGAGQSEQLVMALLLLFFALMLASILMYFAENQAQPEYFSSIPATMWWALETLTTVGYGDVYPITVLGKLMASAVAILGIAVFALPTAILGSGFFEEFEQRRRGRDTCPHCGKEISP